MIIVSNRCNTAILLLLSYRVVPIANEGFSFASRDTYDNDYRSSSGDSTKCQWASTDRAIELLLRVLDLDRLTSIIAAYNDDQHRH